MRLFLLATLALASTGCFIVDSKYYDNLLDGGGGTDLGLDASASPDLGSDGGAVDLAVDMPVLDDSGFPPMGPMCNDSHDGVITTTTRNIPVDTRGTVNSLSVTCAHSGGTPGNDAFFRIDVSSGDYWHFHLQADPTAPESTTRDPALYLLDPGCDSRSCGQISDVCDGNEDEHFAFVAPAAGSWYLGIDDRNAGGGRYLLSAIHPTCGNSIAMGMAGVAEHGEACDDGNLVDGDGCDRNCRREITAALPNEIEPNDNQIEANHVLVVGSTPLIISGDINGSCYNDTFAIDVPASMHVTVNVVSDAAGSPCTGPTMAPYTLTLLNAAAAVTMTGGVDTHLCTAIDSGVLGAGLYFIRVHPNNYHDMPAGYLLQMSVH